VDFRELPLFPDDGAQSVQRARLGATWFWHDLKVNAEYELSFVQYSEGIGGSSALLPGATATGKPRLWDPAPGEGNGFELQHNLDRAMARFAVGPVDITLGRQAITWGSAWFWKPTDRFSPFSPTDVDPEVKRGVDAVRAEWYLGESSSIDLLVVGERHDNHDRELWLHSGARGRTTVGRTDLAMSLVRFQTDKEGEWMGGLELTSEVGLVGVRCEVALNYPEESGEWYVEAVAGGDYRFPFGLTMAGEFFYNGYGTWDSDKYPQYMLATAGEGRNLGERLARGEAFNIGAMYAGLALSQEVLPVLTASISGLTNLADGSAILLGGLRWSAMENARIMAGGIIPIGATPTLDPVPGGMPELTIPTEFGAAPYMAYLLMRLAF